ncbi:hypothetical protein BUE80_DR004796 [Diplocarpon rosae]|nr:hypothetical protein BUE80_DR004796 [Diplocarpon rosae]
MIPARQEHREIRHLGHLAFSLAPSDLCLDHLPPLVQRHAVSRSAELADLNTSPSTSHPRHPRARHRILAQLRTRLEVRGVM